uniref:Uncharacterized protein n=1 Tax=Nothobranchius kadleci TaxID=1051664 RepID=A0A1A8E2I9_NOTKA
MARYFSKAWKEMGLKGYPTIMDIRTAVSTYNFQENNPEVRENLSKFMCHNVGTQERFYALHKNVSRAREIRQLFVCLSLIEGCSSKDEPAAPAPLPAEPQAPASPGPAPASPGPAPPTAASGSRAAEESTRKRTPVKTR